MEFFCINFKVLTKDLNITLSTEATKKVIIDEKTKMPYNPQKDYLKARIFLDKQISSINSDGIRINNLIKTTILNYPVSDKMIRQFIKQYYIDEGLIELRDEVLYVKEKITKT